MDQDRLTGRWSRLRQLVPAAVSVAAVLVVAGGAVPSGPAEWSWLAAALAWCSVPLLLTRCPPAAGLAALVVIAWTLPGLLGLGELWHRGPLIHLLVTAGVWWPRSRAARYVVVGGYALSVAPSAWASLAAAGLGAAALLVARSTEGDARPGSVLGQLPWRTATLITSVAFVVPPLLAWAGVGRAWALPVVTAYQAALVAVAVLVVVSFRPWYRSEAADLAIELSGEPLAELEAALAPRTGDPEATRREAAAAVAAADLLRQRLDERQTEVRAVVSETQESLKRLAVAEEVARRELVDRLEALTGARLAGAIAALESVTLTSSGPTASAALKARDHLVAAVQALGALGRGLEPEALAEGLVPALRRVVESSRVPAHLAVSDEFPAVGLPPPIAAAAYFATAEAVTNAVKHAAASEIRVELRSDASGIEISVLDDGVGGVRCEGSDAGAMATRTGVRPVHNGASQAEAAGSGLAGLRRRVADVGGCVTVRSTAGQGTSVRIAIPVRHD